MQVLLDWLNSAPVQATVVVLVYVAMVMTVRWSLIALPTRGILQAQIDAVRVRFHVDQADVARQTAEEKIVIAQAGKLLSLAEVLISKNNILSDLVDRCLWSRGQECQGWRLVHEAERVLVQILPKEQLRWRLQSAKADLAAIMSESEQAKTAMTELTTLVNAAQNAKTAEADLKACLQEVLRLVFTARDNFYEELVNWHNKALFLIATGIGLVLFLALANCHPMLLLLGAVGGFLGRLTRSLQAGKFPVDYGAYWTTLFLSPIAGALAAWAGVLLIGVLSQDDIKLLGTAFAQVSFPDTASPLKNPTMAAAFLLGFSERFFMRIVSTLEGRSESKSKDADALPTPPAKGESSQSAQPVAGNKAKKKKAKV
jgi:hypothetical protein